MSLEEIFELISEYWEIFIASGAFTTLSVYGAIIIKQLFTRATASTVVTKITNSLLRLVKQIKNKVIEIFSVVNYVKNKIDTMHQEQIEFFAEQRAFMQSILEASGQEDVLLAYNSNLTALNSTVTPVIENVAQLVEEPFESLEEPLTKAQIKLAKKLEKKNKKVNKKSTKEVNANVEELY